MNARNTKVDLYLIDGCGRCPLYQTPGCKVHSWQSELAELRRIALESGLQEEYKWSQPCYTLGNKNIVILSALKDFASLAFFKGVLLKDPDKILVAPGKNSRTSRQLRFTRVEDVLEMEPVIRSYIREAIEVERQGLQVQLMERPEPFPAELQDRCDNDPVFKRAFDALTPGRQRGYILYFSQPKQADTRHKRIEKCLPMILQGKGLHDNYKSGKP